MPGVSEAVIEQHEEAATVAFTGVIALGVVALAALFFRGRPLPAWLGSLMIAASLIVSGLMGWTANLGGQIRHTEIGSNSNTPQATSGDARQ